MKFAKELEQDLVPEWRAKYLNYKAGKKRIKAVRKAINRANNTPSTLARRSGRPTPASAFNAGSPFAFSARMRASMTPREGNEEVDPSHRPDEAPMPSSHVAQPIPTRPLSEIDGLTRSSGNDIQYGSFVPTPPPMSPTIREETRNFFELPGPAIRTPSSVGEAPAQPRPKDTLRRSISRQALGRSMSMVARTGGNDSGPVKETPATGDRAASVAHASPATDRITAATPPFALRRLFTNASITRRETAQVDIGLQNLNAVREREQEFFDFLDSELDKVERFYRSKEEHAAKRLCLLREQLHEMRNRRIHEMAEVRARKNEESDHGHIVAAGHGGNRWINPIRSKMFNPGPNSKALQKMAQTPMIGPRNNDARRDYIRRPESHDVPYRTAKRKLKLALQEFYRGLELLKSYALLNRTAFRKLNKKYDKAVNARPPYRYMSEKVSKADFVTSDVLEGYIQTVEDLYARYFEKGNRKLAAGKLRSLARRPGDESASAFRNGVFIGTGLVFSIQGLSFAGKLLFDEDPTMREQTNYLLQIYGGYFLMLLLFILFCVDCHIWNRFKVNYPFIFEFDTRHNLDWRQLAEFPSFLLFLFGCFLWLNFSQYGSEKMYLYYPVVLIGLTALLILFPAPILRHKSRRWFAYSHYRLLLAGIYPVEFRDFFLGDVYCSLTYATCNMELFFCLYANHWDNPPQCNSNHSRLMGFFSALPPIWRFLQCIRRYKDTKNVFPHLVNGGKYTMTILSAVTLSIYRITPTHTNVAAFIVFSTFNAIYCSIWDLFMDFSLMQTRSSKYLLRDITALKNPLIYYVIMVADVILRFSWIFYAIFTHDVQHSTIVSFLVSFGEAIRRGMWALIRVENEHCANVAQYKASRDVPLPYDIEPTEAGGIETSPLVGPPRDESEERRLEIAQGRLEAGRPPVDTGRSFAKILAEAHKQDFEKRRRPAEGEAAEEEDADDDDEGDEDSEPGQEDTDEQTV